eukprot:scaffold5342_cov101-Isochrysis_galbana.AAC.1
MLVNDCLLGRAHGGGVLKWPAPGLAPLDVGRWGGEHPRAQAPVLVRDWPEVVAVDRLNQPRGHRGGHDHRRRVGAANVTGHAPEHGVVC